MMYHLFKKSKGAADKKFYLWHFLVLNILLLKGKVIRMNKVPELFGSYVFNDDVMRDKLPKDVYKSLRKTIDNGEDLDINVANVVANAMKDWAIEKGATH